LLKINIPGKGDLSLQHLIVDYNGTIAFDGNLISGVAEQLNQLAEYLEIHILTADTFGTASQKCRELQANIKLITSKNGTLEKGRIVDSLGPKKVVAIGNGVNDTLMLKKAALGIAVIGKEGAAQIAISKADVIVNDIQDALGLLLNTTRLKATLRA